MPMTCTLPNTCLPGYECNAYTTTGQYLCCSIFRTDAVAVCPEGEEPYHDPKELFTNNINAFIIII